MRGRGAQLRVSNRFEERNYEVDEEFLQHLVNEQEDVSHSQATDYTKVYPKSILNPVTSPDIGFSWSMNPYQGCEHGCAYCYARNSHEYWGYNAGIDFEQKILVKESAPILLEQALQKPSWEVETIMLSGNTDCYQPIEKKLAITRKLLEVCLKYRQPLGIITKNSLIQRDTDLLEEMAKMKLVRVALSISTLDENLRRKMEPRTASGVKKLETIEVLSKVGVPVSIMAAPIIPGLNSHEIMEIAKAAAEKGALSLNYTMVRLNGIISDLFIDWLDHHFPDRASKVKHLIEQTHGGKLNDSQFGRRMRGEGQVAEQVRSIVQVARKKYFGSQKIPAYNRNDFVRAPRGQMKLFGGINSQRNP
jgi:DNA repair photolyase